MFWRHKGKIRRSFDSKRIRASELQRLISPEFSEALNSRNWVRVSETLFSKRCAYVLGASSFEGSSWKKKGAIIEILGLSLKIHRFWRRIKKSKLASAFQIWVLCFETCFEERSPLSFRRALTHHWGRALRRLFFKNDAEKKILVLCCTITEQSGFSEAAFSKDLKNILDTLKEQVIL